MVPPQLPSTRWLTEKAVSELTGISVSTLQKNRFHRKGIVFSKIGKRSVRYSIQDVQDFMQACRIDVSSAQ